MKYQIEKGKAVRDTNKEPEEAGEDQESDAEEDSEVEFSGDETSFCEQLQNGGHKLTMPVSHRVGRGDEAPVQDGPPGRPPGSTNEDDTTAN